MSRFDEEAKDWDTPESQKRAKHVAEAISSRVPLSTKLSAFEYGCGTGQLSFELSKKVGPITLADNSDGMLEVLDEKIRRRSVKDMKPIKLNLSKDPLPNKQFDIVYTMMTLHHIPNTRQILSSFHKLLNHKGYLCVVDLDKEDGSFHGHDADGVHKGFDRDELAAITEEAGFAHISFSTAYEMEHEIDDGSTKFFPLFLMIAQKNSSVCINN
jgi:ubiquinone/menaquinone biosynthesis C-methylase UbiE